MSMTARGSVPCWSRLRARLRRLLAMGRTIGTMSTVRSASVIRMRPSLCRHDRAQIEQPHRAFRLLDVGRRIPARDRFAPDLYGAFPVKRLFLGFAHSSLFGAGKAVLHPVACDSVPGARGRGQATETLAELGGGPP